MGELDVRTLLDAVRRRLWREQVRAAIRRVAWLSAATMLLAAIVSLTSTPIPVAVVLALIGVEWAVLLAAAASRRPSDRASALWIDRTLGGASAFTTLLDPAVRSPVPAHADAVRWLERWAAAKAPVVLAALGAQRSPVRLARALLALVVCSALALFVLMLSDSLPRARELAAASAGTDAAARDEPPPSSIEAPAAVQLAGDLADALRASEAQRGAERKGSGGAPGAGPSRADDAGAPRGRRDRTAPLPTDATSDSGVRSPAAADADTSAGPGRSAAAAAGRDAGDSPDLRADPGVSRPSTGTIAAARSAAAPAAGSGERQADMDHAAGFDENVAAPGGARSATLPSPAAATPPHAAATARLSLAETSYVEAWMKASGRKR